MRCAHANGSKHLPHNASGYAGQDRMRGAPAEKPVERSVYLPPPDCPVGSEQSVLETPTFTANVCPTRPGKLAARLPPVDFFYAAAIRPVGTRQLLNAKHVLIAATQRGGERARHRD